MTPAFFYRGCVFLSSLAMGTLHMVILDICCVVHFLVLDQLLLGIYFPGLCFRVSGLWYLGLPVIV